MFLVDGLGTEEACRPAIGHGLSGGGGFGSVFLVALTLTAIRPLGSIENRCRCIVRDTTDVFALPRIAVSLTGQARRKEHIRTVRGEHIRGPMLILSPHSLSYLMSLSSDSCDLKSASDGTNKQR